MTYFNLFDYIKSSEVSENVLVQLKGMMSVINHKIDEMEAKWMCENSKIADRLHGEIKRQKNTEQFLKDKERIEKSLRELVHFVDEQATKIKNLEYSCNKKKEQNNRLEQEKKELEKMTETNIIRYEKDFARHRELEECYKCMKIQNTFYRHSIQNLEMEVFDIREASLNLRKYLMDATKQFLYENNVCRAKKEENGITEIILSLEKTRDEFREIKDKICAKLSALFSENKKLMQVNERQFNLIEKYKKIKDEFIKLRNKQQSE